MEARVTHQEFFDALFGGRVEVYNFPRMECDPEKCYILNFTTEEGVKKEVEVRDGKVALLFELTPQVMDKVKEHYIHRQIEGLKKQYKELRIKIRMKQKEERQLRLNSEL